MHLAFHKNFISFQTDGLPVVSVVSDENSSSHEIRFQKEPDDE